MKRLFLSIVCILATIVSLQAQNANRSGVFVELQGGGAFGNVIDAEYDDDSRDYYIKGGFVGSFNFGYRYATSNSVAVELKVGAWGDFVDFGKTITLDMMPGVRWTSKEIGGNVSMFLSLNAGLGLNFPEDANFEDANFYLPVEVGVGFNLTNQLYLGLFLSERIAISGDFGYWNHGSSNLSHYIADTYTSAGIRLGFRF